MLFQHTSVQRHSQHTRNSHISNDRELTDAELKTVVGGRRSDFLAFAQHLQHQTLFLQLDVPPTTASHQAHLRDIRERDINRNHRVHRLDAPIYS